MSDDLARDLMEQFADSSGISGKTTPRRYLWTDAFAVCNFLGLSRRTGDARYRYYAQELVNQVHHVLGRHRDDDPRQGWISGLPNGQGEQHPTLGGLRIGKPLNERGPDEIANPNLEWDRDGQYFHYLTKWMHSLCRIGRETSDKHYTVWAAELAVTAHHAFSYRSSRQGPKRMFWKMSIDLSRPLVSAMGQHDPLDGLVSCLELHSAPELEREDARGLTSIIEELTPMSESTRWRTEDPLGIGGLLHDATRLAQLVYERGVERRQLLYQVMVDTELSLEDFCHTQSDGQPVEHRLAFRELGLSIGLHGLQRIKTLVAGDRELTALNNRLLQFEPLAERIENFWSNPDHRLVKSWQNHFDINTVMLATSLAPESYLVVD